MPIMHRLRAYHALLVVLAVAAYATGEMGLVHAWLGYAVSVVLIGRVLWDEFFSNNDWPMAASVAVVMVLLIIVPIALFNKHLAENSAGAQT